MPSWKKITVNKNLFPNQYLILGFQIGRGAESHGLFEISDLIIFPVYLVCILDSSRQFRASRRAEFLH